MGRCRSSVRDSAGRSPPRGPRASGFRRWGRSVGACRPRESIAIHVAAVVARQPYCGLHGIAADDGGWGAQPGLLAGRIGTGHRDTALYADFMSDSHRRPAVKLCSFRPRASAATSDGMLGEASGRCSVPTRRSGRPAVSPITRERDAEPQCVGARQRPRASTAAAEEAAYRMLPKPSLV